MYFAPPYTIGACGASYSTMAENRAHKSIDERSQGRPSSDRELGETFIRHI